MKKAEIPERLIQAHNALWEVCQKINPVFVHKRNNGKWSALQHMQHVVKGIEAINRYLKKDKNSIADTFGFVDRRSRSYMELLQAYNDRLREGAVSTLPFNPDESEDISFTKEKDNGTKIIEEMIECLKSWTEEQLDHYACPHPTLGNLTACEMLYFAIIHAKHHTNGIVKMNQADH